MFISHKSNVIQQVHELEWQCRRLTKGMIKDEYWAWVDTVTTDGVADYSGETGYTIVECTDENVSARLVQLSEYINNNREPGEALVYNIKYYTTKRDSEIDGVKSHFIGDDTAKDKRILDEEWVRIRAKRDRLLAETDWMSFSDSPTMSEANKTYRQKLRDLPSDQSSKKTYADITWPTKP